MTKKEELLEFVKDISDDQLLYLTCLFNDNNEHMNYRLRIFKGGYELFIDENFDEDLISISEYTLERPYTINTWVFEDRPVIVK
jgi:hypothetical protein